MERLTPGDFAPPDVQRYLLPHEQQNITIRRHPSILLPPIASAVGGAVVSGVMHTALHDQQLLLRLIQALSALLCVELLRAFIRWRHGYIVITSHRLIICSGLYGRRVDTISLESLEEIAFRKSASGHLLGYGTLLIHGRPFLDYIPFPEHVYLEIESLIFQSKPEIE
jgi:hypothetical protein